MYPALVTDDSCMTHAFSKWLRKSYNKITGSIAFYPAIIAIGFLVLSWLMLELDSSEMGKHIKSNYHLVRLRDASTARTITSTIVTGIISLAVFSFSMVMILLNQAASQLSNRTLENMISNRFQQLVLGCYVGTIVYDLFLLSTIRDIDSGIYVPALSIYLLLVFTVGDIFLFVYFLHYITQTVKFETIIKKVREQTLKTLGKDSADTFQPEFAAPDMPQQTITMPVSNYYQDFDDRELLRFASKHNCIISFIHPKGTYLLQSMPLLTVYRSQPLTTDEQEELLDSIDLYVGQPTEKNYYFGFHQLTEIALKALSPGINDPQTAVLSLHAITHLCTYLLQYHRPNLFRDKDNEVRIVVQERSFEELFNTCYLPIWNYGKDDQYIQQAMKDMLTQLLQVSTGSAHNAVISQFLHHTVEGHS